MALFTILTPCFNAERYIVETARSVLEQTALSAGTATLQYLVLDGGSTDRTVERVRALGDPRVEVISEPDRGMYDALAKGLRRAQGDIVAYLNAGDYYHKCALEIVGDVFARRGARWLTGLNTRYTQESWAVHFHLPYRYRRSLFECGAYGNQLPFVQQESTFWARELTSAVDLGELAGFRLAGDYLLWRRFCERAPLTIVEAHLGGFRSHPGQLSERLDDYRAEMRRLTRPPGPADLALAAADKLLWSAPAAVKKQLNPDLLRYDFGTQGWT